MMRMHSPSAALSWPRVLAALAAFGVLASALVLAPAAAKAQTVDAPSPQARSESARQEIKERYLVNRFPDKPSLPPAFTIPLDPLGYSAPGSIYLGARNALASLDFLDENHLLFTFRVPGLLHRDSEKDDESVERQIRALVLNLPQGTVAAQAQWTLHDRARYIWALKNGHFLLRDRTHLLESDATLALKPVLDFPGDLLWLDLDPDQKFLVTNSREPVVKPAKPGPGAPSAPSQSSQVSSPSTASANITMDEDPDKISAEPDLVVRILQRETAQVLLTSRVRSAIHLPINSQGYLQNLRGRASDWILDLSFFTGGSRILGSVQSDCSPEDDFLSEDEILASGCGPQGETRLVAISTAGRTLWASQAPTTEIWPKLTIAANGLRFAWETLDTGHPINSYAPVDPADIKEQSVTVFDAANGDIALVSPVSPVLDAGGNVAISPSGCRVALLVAGAIQVFELPAPPPLPAAPAKHAGH